jgi:hypothetical protein
MKKLLFMAFSLFFFFANACFAQEYNKNSSNKNTEWTSFMSPGIGYSYYFPLDKANLGTFSGISTEFSFVNHHDPFSSGPANFRLYTRVGILQSSKDSVGGLISYSFGGTFSLENAVKRDFLVPYCGLEMGGINQKELGGGFTIAPVVGLQIWANRFFSVQAQGSYNYSTKLFDRLSGFTASAALNVHFWRK